MKKIIRLTESDLTRIIKRVVKEESEQKTELMMKDLDVAMGSDEDLGDKIEKHNVCNVCIKSIEGVSTIPACQRLCEKRRKRKRDVSDCVMGFSRSKYGGSMSDMMAPRIRLFHCLIGQFKLKMAKTNTSSSVGYDDMSSSNI